MIAEPTRRQILRDRLSATEPGPARSVLKACWQGCLLLRRLTSSARPLPTFVIIGTQRGGTTSLYNYLVGHPSVRAALTKEVGFFDLNFWRGEGWYRSQFPVTLGSKRFGRTSVGPISGEASPNYMFDAAVPARMKAMMPDAKLIVLLRNPVNRAYSSYCLETMRGNETLGFESAVEREFRYETALAAGDEETLAADLRGFRPYFHSYVARGRYSDQLRQWLGTFSLEQILVLRSEDLYSDTSGCFHKVLQFLNLDRWLPENFERHNRTIGMGMEPKTREWLTAYFRPYNRQLSELLGRDFGWD